MEGDCKDDEASLREIPIKKTPKGKPYLDTYKNFHFSLSHSGDLIVLATADAPIGVDVEKVDRKIKLSSFKRFLHPHEIRMLDDAECPKELFFKIWTVREAFSKEEGEGLSILDKDFCVDYENDHITYGGRKVFFKSMEHGGYFISVCCEKPTGLSFNT